MTGPIWLIAGREFRAYATTASFWVALAIGPLLMSGALLLTSAAPHHGSPAASLTLTPTADGATEARFSEGFPLSADARLRMIRGIAAEQGRPVRMAPAPPKSPITAAGLSRFVLSMMLWTTLTGSLGMLLQAVVRERSNRALESLLAAVQARDIVLGKVIGVGAVSVLVLAAWLGASAALAAFVPASGGLVSALIHGLASPLVLARAAVIYLLAFGFYGLVTVAVGALARDNADAQNLARPMFAVLLAVFFTVLASAGGAQKLDWLVYVPPFTPFLLLMQAHSAAVEATSLALLALATAGAGVTAVRVLRLGPAGPTVRRVAAAH